MQIDYSRHTLFIFDNIGGGKQIKVYPKNKGAIYYVTNATPGMVENFGFYTAKFIKTDNNFAIINSRNVIMRLDPIECDLESRDLSKTNDMLMVQKLNFETRLEKNENEITKLSILVLMFILFFCYYALN